MLVAITTMGCGDCNESKRLAKDSSATAPFARLKGLQGQVRIRRDGKWYKGAEGLALRLRDAVSTGPDGEVLIVFKKGTTLRLKSGTTLELADAADGVLVQIGDGELSIDMTADPTELTISVEGGGARRFTMSLGTIRVVRDKEAASIKVIEGEAVVMGPEGRAVVTPGKLIPAPRAAPVPAAPKDAGSSGLTVETSSPEDQDATSPSDASLADTSLPSDAGPQDVPSDVTPQDVPSDVTPQDVPVEVSTPKPSASSGLVLLDRRRSGWVRSPGDSGFAKNTQRKVPLSASTSIKAGRRDLLLRGADGSSVSVIRGAHIQLLGGGGPRRLALIQGSVRVRTSGGQTAYRVRVGARSVLIEPSGGRSVAKVSRNGDALVVTVRSGRATVRVGGQSVRVRAGYVLKVSGQGGLDGPKLAGRVDVVAREGRRVRIFYDRKPRLIGLKWRAGPGVLEVARDRGFKRKLVTETLDTGRFHVSTRGGRRVYWRVKRGGSYGPIGHVSMASDPNLRRRGGAARNTVRDTGRETRIYFQGKSPVLTFTWKKVPDAVAYRLKVYRTQSLSRPLLTRRIRGNRARFKSGRLKEGVYFWYQEALGADGKRLKASEMNKLSLTFDNWAPSLRIDSPRPGKGGGSPLVTGVVARGRTVRVNGKVLRTGADGRFSQRVKARGGMLRFHLRGGRSDTFYLRRVR